MSTQEKHKFKVTVIGDGGVGKTSLIQKFTQGIFQEDYLKTIGAQVSKYTTKINDDKIYLLFWDIAGQDDFLFLRPTFYKASDAAIIVYSLEENDLGKRSLLNIETWYKDIQEFCGTIPVVIFANKVDLINLESLNKTKLQQLVDDHNSLGYYITSAKTGQGVDSAFKAIIDILYSKSQ